jgi:serine/threonine-protein kinase
VHRDIKPANIMYDPVTRSIKVTDFGIARVTDTSQTRTGVVLGSPSYMSPEQLAGQRVDGRSDLFALGVTAFELLTGRQPFEGETLAALMYQIANTPHPNPLSIRGELPGCLRAVFDKALAKNPEQRYQTGTEFADGLRDCLTTRTNKKRKSTGVA